MTHPETGKTNIPGAADDADVLLNVEGHEHVRVEALGLVVGVGDLAGVDDGEVGDKVLDLGIGLGADEHVAHKVLLPRQLRDEADCAHAQGKKKAGGEGCAISERVEVNR